VNPHFRDPKRLPTGFAALLEDMWLRLVEMEDRETSKRVIDGLGVLAIAGEALPLSIVASLLGWEHPADIATVKRHALQFLLEERADWHGGEARYRPFHEATREFLTSGDHMWLQVRRNHHKLLAEGLAAWHLRMTRMVSSVSTRRGMRSCIFRPRGTGVGSQLFSVICGMAPPRSTPWGLLSFLAAS